MNMGRSAQASQASMGFAGHECWAALRSANIDRDVRALFQEARLLLRRRGGLPMQARSRSLLCPESCHS